MSSERHSCGGTVRATTVYLTRRSGGLTFKVPAPGKRCRRCGEAFISRDTARELENGLLVGVSRSGRGRNFRLSHDMPVVIGSTVDTTIVQDVPWNAETREVSFVG